MRACRGIDAGFTLVELMAVVAIIGILVSIAIATHSMAVQNAGGVTCENNRRTFERVAGSDYRLDHDTPPTSIADLTPYVVDWPGVIFCPTDSTRELFLDLTDQRIVCPVHDK